MPDTLTRRDAVRIGNTVFFSGAIAALEALLTGCGDQNTTSTATTATTSTTTTSAGSSSSSCTLATNVTRGPYFIDNQADSNIASDVVDASIPQRSDIRADTKSSGATQAGLPLTLTINVGSYATNACSPISGAQVHIWHCNAQGQYSDVGTLTSVNFLRGYAYTDASGNVTFTTIYPGWYQGRAVHIHIKVRIFDSTGKVTSEATTQFFFDDSASTAVYAANSAYKSGTRDTLNAADSIYKSESPALLLGLTGSATSGYTSSIAIGINVGTIYGG